MPIFRCGTSTDPYTRTYDAENACRIVSVGGTHPKTYKPQQAAPLLLTVNLQNLIQKTILAALYGRIFPEVYHGKWIIDSACLELDTQSYSLAYPLIAIWNCCSTTASVG
jgi:hypothetical protein